MTGVCITIGSELQNAILAGEAVHAICAALAVQPDMVDDVRLCVVEGVTNAIRHSYRAAPGGEVSVHLAVEPDRVVLEITDSGTPMSPDKVALLLNGPRQFDFDQRRTEDLPEGGMGLGIIRATMDEIAYTPEDGLNRLRMVKHR